MSMDRTEVCEVHGAYSSTYNEVSELWNKCPVCSQERDRAIYKQREEQKRKADADRYEKNIRESKMPELYWRRNFKDYEIKNEDQEKVRNYCMAYAKNFDVYTTESLILCGSKGTGKTHLACVIGLRLCAKNYKVKYASAAHLIREIKSTWHKKSEFTELEMIETYVEPHLLILDEIGVQHGTEYESSLFFEILSARYYQSKPCILLSNCRTNEEFSKYINDLVMSRLSEHGVKEFIMAWDDYRMRPKNEIIEDD